MNLPFDIDRAMELAINEARRGAGFVSPNPLVGCVILDSKGEELSRGFHPKLGKDHAEVDALKKIKDKKLLEGAHMVVTLEPCAHDGRTPSCANAIKELPLASVTYGLLDPNPLTAGKGAQIISASGIHCQEYLGDKIPLEELAEQFLINQRMDRAFISLKVASSIDGQMALSDGSSKWITSEQSRALAHHLRATHDGILVGRKTFEVDNPSLNIRHDEFPDKRNKVIVLDPKGKTKNLIEGSNIHKHHPPEDIFIVTEESVEFKGMNNITCSLDESGTFKLSELTNRFLEFGIHSVLVEGGALVHSSFLLQGCWDRLHLFMAPKIFGSTNGISWSQEFGISNMAEACELSWPRSTMVGSDMYYSARNLMAGKNQESAD